MIKLFVTDIDGCLATPYEPYDLEGLATLRRLAAEAGAPAESHPTPAVSVCSGRPYPYVEAITQALGLSVPVLFEGGGGRFDPVAAQTTWTPTLTDEVEAEIEKVRHWFVTECVPGTKMSIDHAKRTQAGIVSPDPDEIADVKPRTEHFVSENVPDLRVFSTEVSIDVVPPGITKRTGLDWLTTHLDVDMSEVAYVGDADSDLGALSAVGTSFAPANADEEVLRTVDHVTEGHVIDGTLEAYRQCLDWNKAERTPADRS
jgi:HAD superfamily hydrolase (TIGR01484 family)